MNKALLLLAAGAVFVDGRIRIARPGVAAGIDPAGRSARENPPCAPSPPPHRAPAAQPPAPIGSPAPSQAEAGTTPAPMPNEDIGPPRAPTDTSASVDPGSLSIHYPPLGNGYLPGSSPQDMANTQTPKVPGVTVNMPLQQPQPQPLPPPAEPAGPAPAPGQ